MEETNNLCMLFDGPVLSVGVLLAEDALFNAGFSSVDLRVAKSGLRAWIREILKKGSRKCDDDKRDKAKEHGGDRKDKRRDEKRPRLPSSSSGRKRVKLGSRSSPLMEKIEETTAPREVLLDEEQPNLPLVRSQEPKSSYSAELEDESWEEEDALIDKFLYLVVDDLNVPPPPSLGSVEDLEGGRKTKKIVETEGMEAAFA